jgi:hypothetical protein
VGKRDFLLGNRIVKVAICHADFFVYIFFLDYLLFPFWHRAPTTEFFLYILCSVCYGSENLSNEHIIMKKNLNKNLYLKQIFLKIFLLLFFNHSQSWWRQPATKGFLLKKRRTNQVYRNHSKKKRIQD